MSSRRLATALCAAALLTADAGAHHSQVMFETAQVTLAGTVARFEFTNPHIYVFVDLAIDAVAQSYRLEGGAPSALRALGWSATILQPGERVTVTFSKSKDGAKVGLLRWLLKADGKALPAGAGGDGARDSGAEP